MSEAPLEGDSYEIVILVFHTSRFEFSLSWGDVTKGNDFPSASAETTQSGTRNGDRNREGGLSPSRRTSKHHPELLEPLPQLEPVGGWTSRAAQVTPLVRLRVCSPAGHAPSTGRLAFLLRPVAQRADCARLVPCCASTCRPATSDGGHRSRCGRCWWCHGLSPRSGCFRDRGRAGCARFDGPGCFSTPQLDRRSLGGGARDGRFVLSSL